MKILCLVPSITETLIECQVNVVGRTRFCIHPTELVKDIAVVGGTKDVHWGKIKKLEPDLVIFDKEENTLEMAESCPYPYIALHISSVDNVAQEFDLLARKLNNTALKQIAQRWRKIALKPAKQWRQNENIPALIHLLVESNDDAHQKGIREERYNESQSTIQHVEYMIWKKPWMAVGPNTFIWSVLEKLGFADYLIKRDDKYPNLSDEMIPDSNTFYLFSSEPFPFERYQKQLIKTGFKGAIIDGECYSWYGIRSLKFLETQLESGLVEQANR